MVTGRESSAPTSRRKRAPRQASEQPPACRAWAGDEPDEVHARAVAAGRPTHVRAARTRHGTGARKLVVTRRTNNLPRRARCAAWSQAAGRATVPHGNVGGQNQQQRPISRNTSISRPA